VARPPLKRRSDSCKSKSSHSEVLTAPPTTTYPHLSERWSVRVLHDPIGHSAAGVSVRIVRHHSACSGACTTAVDMRKRKQ
jgi:hypothetical protein